MVSIYGRRRYVVVPRHVRAQMIMHICTRTRIEERSRTKGSRDGGGAEP